MKERVAYSLPRRLFSQQQQSPFKSYFKITKASLPRSLTLRRMRVKETIERSHILSSLLRLAVVSIGRAISYIGYTVSILMIPGCEMPFQASLKTFLIAQIHEKHNKSRMEFIRNPEQLE